MAIKVGEVVSGTITGITNFGAFVKINDQQTGLVHISEVSHDYVSNIKDYLKEGQKVQVKIVEIDPKGKISLSIRQAKKKSAKMPEVVDLNARNKQPRNISFEDKISMFLKESNERQDGSKLKQKEGRKRKSK